MTKSLGLTPAEYCIQVFGGVRALARAIGRTPSCVTRWKRSQAASSVRQPGDIPNNAQRMILKIAKVRKLDISAEDVIWGRRGKA